MDNFNYEDAGNNEGLEYDDENDMNVQVTNPDKKHDHLNQIDSAANNTAQNQNQEESDEEVEEQVIDTTPSFFSQRFASDLIRNDSQDICENQENINFNNSLMNRIG